MGRSAEAVFDMARPTDAARAAGASPAGVPARHWGTQRAMQPGVWDSTWDALGVGRKRMRLIEA